VAVGRRSRCCYLGRGLAEPGRRGGLFASTTAVLFAGMMAFLGSLYLIALFLQDRLGLSALNAGLSTFPEALGVMGGAQIAARL
jgi:hypothetical protein